MSIAEVKRKVIADIEFDVGQGLVYRRRTSDQWSPEKKKSAVIGTFQNYYC